MSSWFQCNKRETQRITTNLCASSCHLHVFSHEEKKLETNVRTLKIYDVDGEDSTNVKDEIKMRSEKWEILLLPSWELLEQEKGRRKKVINYLCKSKPEIKSACIFLNIYTVGST